MNQIYLDVDGCLNPITYKHRRKHWEDYKRHRIEVYPTQFFRVWLSEQMGAEFLRLAREYSAEIVWSTTWMHEANKFISPIIGLPDDLRVTRFDEVYDTDKTSSGKIPAIAEMCNDNAIVVIDDWLGFKDKCWLKERQEEDGYPTLGIKPYETVGITKAHIAQIGEFFGSL